MNRPPEPPPEGVLIESARTQARLSVREAARRAGISEGWWRQVVKGYQSLSGGSFGTVRGVPAETIAKMARAAGVTPELLEAEGQRPDAAEAMRDGALRVKAEPAPHRFSLPEPTPEMRRDLDPLLAEVGACVRVAAAAYPGQRLDGARVFPPGEHAPTYWGAARLFWDQAMAEDFSQDDAVDVVAALVARYRQLQEMRRQNGSAAGLIRHRPLVHAVR
jgi:transcriptional regulator with XRE-family HTH domain